MSAARLRLWYLVHKWTSLACTIFLLVLCLTGLPLIFSHEIYDWLDDGPPYAALPASAPLARLDEVVDAALRRHPSETVRSVFIDDDEPQVLVTLAPSPAATPKQEHTLKFDSRTAQFLKEFPPAAESPFTFMDVMFQLHTELFAGLPGELFLAVIALLFAGSLVSGTVLYGPFMRKIPFGTVRRKRSTRLEWLDLHNLLGIATLVWALVVGVTGVLNELSTPLFGLWRTTEVRALLAPYRDKPVVARRASLQSVFDTARAALPGQTITGIDYPNADLESPRHYVVWTKGGRPLTSKLFTPAMVDAQDGELTAIAQLPWYLKALEVSRPLHFGDYGGLPLKLIWAMLDLVTIFVLGSGLYLWWVRRDGTVQRVEMLIRHHGAESASDSQ